MQANEILIESFVNYVVIPVVLIPQVAQLSRLEHLHDMCEVWI
jgi:hypothetical protein